MIYEQNQNSFVGEVACERWDVAVCRKYLRGVNFYYLCDYSDIKEVLEYNGSIHQLER